VNPNVAMLTGFMCHSDPAVARARGAEGAQFFAYGLGHYWRDGVHRPGHTELWRDFQGPVAGADAVARERSKAGMGGIGTPAELIENFRAYEEAGVDQLILLQQCGNYRPEHVRESLELFAAEVLPQFKARDAEHEARKQRELAPAVAAALGRLPPIDPPTEPVEVAAYPRYWAEAEGARDLTPDRRPGMAALWQTQVGGRPKGGGGR
jgi:hypothetical protein